MLNDRQIATLLWIGLLLVAVLVWPTGRKGLVDVARGFLSRSMWLIFALLALCSLGLVLIGRRIGISRSRHVYGVSCCSSPRPSTVGAGWKATDSHRREGPAETGSVRAGSLVIVALNGRSDQSHRRHPTVSHLGEQPSTWVGAVCTHPGGIVGGDGQSDPDPRRSRRRARSPG